MKKINALILFICCVTLSSCGWLINRTVAEKQGNILTEERSNEIQIGMSKAQVAYILGYPVLQNPFEPDRWEYVHMVTIGNEDPNTNKLIVIFKDDHVSEIING